MLCLGILLFGTNAYAQSASSNRLITSEEVYENPDDHQLNLDYAKQEIKRGEMLNAASALERMLYANPNWHSARLLYAAVLYRLDDPQAAMRELSLLEGRDLNTQQIETYKRYQTTFETPLPPRSKTATADLYTPHDAIKASFSIGFRGDNNAGNALTDQGFGFSNQGDVSVHAQGRVAISSEITETNKLSTYAVAGGQIRRHETFSQADYAVIDLQVGVRAKPGKKGYLSAGIDARQINISEEKYLQQIGPRVSFSQTLNKNTKASVSLSAYHQDYDVLPNATLEDERDGVRSRLQLGLQKQLKPTQKLTLALGYDTKTAGIGAFAYKGPQALVGFENKLNDGFYTNTRVQLRLLNYRDSLSEDVDKREDKRFAFRQSFGMPLSYVSKNPNVKQAALEFGINYNKRASNVDSNDYDNLGVDLKLKFNF